MMKLLKDAVRGVMRRVALSGADIGGSAAFIKHRCLN